MVSFFENEISYILKAIFYTRYGTPDVLQVKEVPKPLPSDHEVLVKVHAASINSWDWDMVRGKPLVVRMWGLFRPKYKIPGCDIAGRVEAVGRLVTKFKPGDEVFGDLCESGFGAFAEYTCALEKSLALKSPAMSFEKAAAIPQASMLAVQGLLDVGMIRSGQKILINGAGGGVGTFAIQLAKLQGAEVTAVDHSDKLELLSSLGADHVIDYTREDFTRTGNKYDLILDAITSRSIFACVRALNRNGAYVTVGGSLPLIFLGLFFRPWIAWFSRKHYRMVAMKANKDLGYMKELFEAGKIWLVIEGPYKLKEVPETFRFFATGKHKGKIVITV